MRNRPTLPVQKTVIERVLNIISIILLVGMIGYVATMWGSIGDRVPIHFNAVGEPDAWSGKFSIIGILIVPVALYMFLTFLGNRPHTHNYLVEITEENAQRQYKNSCLMLSWLKIILIATFAYDTWRTVDISLDRANGLGTYSAVVFIGLLFGTIAIFIFRSIRLK
ncbi:DUF1648 domain-containing protein [Ectobacillus antri]|uniref:DUF1648 domain-containing protein n=1 Tax=Ectobacillus antri TaxID=2486280 RepID=UPI0013DE5B79|nr:DUF1648 domain-containing protein [Ectobacillus antri]